MRTPFVQIVYRPKSHATEEEITCSSNISPLREQGLIDLAISSFGVHHALIEPMWGSKMRNAYTLQVTRYTRLDGEEAITIEGEGLTAGQIRCILFKALDKLRAFGNQKGATK